MKEIAKNLITQFLPIFYKMMFLKIMRYYYVHIFINTCGTI